MNFAAEDEKILRCYLVVKDDNMHVAMNQNSTSPAPGEGKKQHPSHVIQQSKDSQNEAISLQLGYWEKKLAGDLAHLQLPVDFPRPVGQISGVDCCQIRLPEQSMHAIEELGRTYCVSTYVILLSIFSILIHRYTGEGDILLGTFGENQNSYPVQNIREYFAGIYILKNNINGEHHFSEVVDQVKKSVGEIPDNREILFADVQKRISTVGESELRTLFDVVFNMKQISEQRSDHNNWIFAPYPSYDGLTIADLCVEIETDAQEANIYLVYNSGLFKAETIARLLDNYKELIHSVLSGSEQKIGMFGLISAAEADLIKKAQSGEKVDVAQDATLVTLFEEQVLKTPDRIAIEQAGVSINYDFLNRRANQLAHSLRSMGVQSETLVGLCMERSPEMIIGLLGILKAGCAYVPLDPAYPPERLNTILDDVKTDLIITQESLLGKLQGFTEKAFCIDRDRGKIFEMPDNNPERFSTAHHLAYVIYTSGSTGKPKGVMIEHRSLVNFVGAIWKEFKTEADDRVLQFATINFDTSIEEIFPTLLKGATLILRTNQMLDSMPTFLNYCREWRLTVLDLPTAFWHELVQFLLDNPQDFPESVRLVIIGGERAVPERVSAWLKKIKSRAILLNTYGLTETTCITTAIKLVESDMGLNAFREVSIGRPISNVKTYILDKYMQPVPLGVTGELYFGGMCLGRGYLNRPELTSERFISDPFDSDGGRLYRTGDIARFREDGSIEYLGRNDDQVKIRGYRVEPGEIETVLLNIRQVKSAVVLGRKDTYGQNHLVAYVTGDGRNSLDISSISSILAEKLPNYMLPSYIIPVDSIPTNSNGKVDRFALPAPDFSQRRMKGEMIAPRNSLEERLVQIWREVLGIQEIGVEDDFFELGGESLKVIALLGKIEKEFRREIPLNHFFQTSTIADLASFLGQAEEKEEWASLVPIHPQGSRLPFFCVHADGGVFIYQILSNLLGEDQPLYGLQARGLDGKEVPFASLEDMAAHYIKEIKTIQPEGPYYIGAFSLGGIVLFEMGHQLHNQGDEIGMLAFIDASGPTYPVIPNRFSWLVYKISTHINTLKLLDLKGMIIYLWKRTYKRFLRLISSVLGGIFTTLNMKIPKFVRYNYVRSSIYKVVNKYQPLPYDGKITIFRAKEQPRGCVEDPYLGWGELVKGGIDVITINSSHNTIMKEPFVHELIEQLRIGLDRKYE